jgi:hypothetical protein
MAGTCNLEYADQVIILNDSTTYFNLPTPFPRNRNPSSGSLYYPGGPSFIQDTENVGFSRKKHTSPNYPEGGFVGTSVADYAQNSYKPGEVYSWEMNGALMAVTVIQDDVGGRTIPGWRQFKTTSGFSNYDLSPQPAQPDATPYKATTYIFKGMGIFVGWVPIAVHSGHIPFLRPIKSSMSSYVRGFTTQDGSDDGLASGAIADFMKFPTAIRKYFYDLGLWVNPSNKGEINAGAMSPELLASNGSVGTVQQLGGQTAQSYGESWFNQNITNGADRTAAHEYGHLIDAVIYQSGIWEDGRDLLVQTGQRYVNVLNRRESSNSPNFTRRCHSLSEDPTLQTYFFQSLELYKTAPWSGSQMYNIGLWGIRLVGLDVLPEWIPPVVSGFIVGLTDQTAGDAQMLCAIPPSLLTPVKNYLSTQVFGSGGLGLI